MQQGHNHKCWDRYVHDFVVIICQEGDRRTLFACTTRTTCTIDIVKSLKTLDKGEALPIRCTYASMVPAIW